MKLRIRSNTLRFRLGQQDVSRLADGGPVEERVRFGPGPENDFVYRVEPSALSGRMALRYNPGHITLLLDASLCSALGNPEQTGFEERIATGTGEEIEVLIEKDFACLQPRNPKEDKGTFPNPLSRSHQP